MRVPAAVYVALGVGLTLGAAIPGSISAQVPTAEPQTRVAAPARGGVIQTAPPTEAAAPVGQTPAQPTAAPTAAAPTEPAPVSAAPPPSGVTQLPPATAPPATASSSQAATAGKDRPYAAGKSLLTLDGGPGGWLRAVEGGGISADVVSVGAKKHIAAPKFETISLQVGWEAKPLLDWVAASWKGGAQRKNGSVSSLDFDYKVRSVREFTNALVTATTFPALDGSSKDPAYLTVKLAPEMIRLLPGSGATATSTAGTVQSKAWLPANFRLELPGLDVGRVSRIESFTVGQQVTEQAVGDLRVSQKEAGGFEFPTLKITVSEPGTQTWVDWSDDFIVKGNNGDEKEKNGAIVFLDPSLKGELARVSLFNCGIAGLGPTRQEANAESVRKMTAELYCERMELITK